MDEIQQARDYGAAQRAEGFSEGETAGFSKGETAGFSKGETAGKIGAVLAIVAARGIALDESARARIEGCGDLSTLDNWISRAVTASSINDIFDSNADRT